MKNDAGLFHVFGYRIRFMWFESSWLWSLRWPILHLGPLSIVVSRQP
jgi:hypothetical protein